jgi:hypothetical protein
MSGLRIRRAAVLEQREPLLELAARLHASAPVDIAVVARLERSVDSASTPASSC